MTLPRRARAPRPLEMAFAAAIALGVAGGITTGCDPNAIGPLLVPTGGSVPGAPCTSTYTSMRMVGDFTTPGFSIPISPEMQLERVNGECVWRVSVQLNAGPVLFKFVTNEAFDDDYVGDESQSLAVPGGPHPTSIGSGSGNAIKIEVASAGRYDIFLNERTLSWRAEAGAPPPLGGIAGSVSFANLSSAPFPTARVEVFAGATPVANTTTDPTTRAFSLSGLDAGTYRVVVSSSCFGTVELPSVTVAGATNDVGEVALSEGGSSFATIDIVGGFNLFTPGVNPMVQSPACVWTGDVVLNPGVYNMKFLTDGQFDSPPDYGGDETTVFDVPGGGPVRPVSGPGTAIKISVANPGTYRFVLDERVQQWFANPVTPAPSGGEER